MSHLLDVEPLGRVVRRLCLDEVHPPLGRRLVHLLQIFETLLVVTEVTKVGLALLDRDELVTLVPFVVVLTS